MSEDVYRVEVSPDRTTTVKSRGLSAEQTKGLVLLAHGMNNDLDHTLLTATSAVWSGLGFRTVRFNFLYREAGKDRADSNPVLMDCLSKVYSDSLDRWQIPAERIVIGGKSLGARIAAQAALQGIKTRGLIHLGFPLVPPGKPEAGREEMLLGQGNLPQMFFAGTRDPLCPLERLEKVVQKLAPTARLYVIPGGDHSFNLPKDSSGSDRDVEEEITKMGGVWLTELFGEKPR